LVTRLLQDHTLWTETTDDLSSVASPVSSTPRPGVSVSAGVGSEAD
jgi:hypothetical protein